ncbi:hypothetical protein C8J56DRAFT_1026375 [Mycena floridula]|nr:hypothetical protein C8J56DRAFT_1026375 [Mycena floridula]
MRLSVTLLFGFVALVGAVPLSGPKRPCGTATMAVAKPQPMPDPSVFITAHQNDLHSSSTSRARMRKYRKKMRIKKWRKNCRKKKYGCRRKTKSADDAEESEEPDDDDSGEDGFDI